VNPHATPLDPGSAFAWLRTGTEGFAAMLGAIEAATASVRLQTYTFAACPLGERFRAALVAARRRGAQVQVLVDALGSRGLPGSFWDPLVEAGGEFRWFNPLFLNRLSYRDHRKILVCDEQAAFVGGFNIAPEYEGDGVTRGWRDLGLRISGPLAAELAETFDAQFARADFTHKRLQRLRRASHEIATGDEWKLLLSGPGRRHGEIKRTLARDLKSATSVKIAAAYFLPTWRLRKELLRVCRRGGRVQLILAGRSDVKLSQLASQRLYRLFLRGGVEIFEYQPQVLHAKMFIVDNAVYVGSSNLDARSLQINYELVVRLAEPRLAAEARELFGDILSHSHRIDPITWRRSRTFWNRLRERWAYLILARLDPLLARWQLKNLR
jgi:cardiolipin synthase A/B